MKMSQANFLDTVIRKADAATKANSSTEKVVIINRKTGEVIPKKRLFGGNLAFYLVSNTNDDSNIAERQALPCNVKDFDNRELCIFVTYWASCEPENEDKVAKSLCSDNLPGDELDKKIKKWIAKFTRNDAAGFIDNYFTLKSELIKFVKANVQQEVGLNLEMKLSLDKEDQLKPFPIEPIQFSVHVCDCDDELYLQLRTELILDEQNKVKAILNYGRDILLVNLVKIAVKKYLIKNITLHQFCYELKNTVRHELVKHLNRILSDYGRQVRYLSLDSDSVSPGKELLDDRSYDIECTVQGYPEPILVQNRLYMQPQDIGKYRAAQSPNLETWVNGKLESIVKPLMLPKKYIDILLNFEPIAKTIKAKINEAANAIGYQVTHIVSAPNLEPLKLQENFIIEKEDTFATKDARVNVKLSISVTIKIQNLVDIENYLNRQLDVKELMKEAIYNATRDYLNKIEPERFYMRFSNYDEQIGEKQSVEQELADKIQKVLEESFAGQVSSIVPKYLDTDIAKCFQDLQRQISSFEFEVLSLKGGEPVKFQGDFQIQDVEKYSWYIFQSRQPKITDIRQSIEKSLKAKLNIINNEVLQYEELNDLLAIEDAINKLAADSVVKQFGLKISITNVCRTRTEQEDRLSEARRKLDKVEVEQSLAHLEAKVQERDKQLEMSSRMNQAKFAELERLYEQRLKLIVDEENESEIEYLNKKISILEKEVPNPSLEDARSNLNRLEPKRPKAKGFQELAQEINLLQNKNPSVPNSANDTDISAKEIESKP